MRPTTRKGRIGKRRVYLNDKEILSESTDGLIYRVPIYGSKLVTGHWYADVLYSLEGRAKNRLGLIGSDRWRHPVFLHFAGFGTASIVDQFGVEERVLVCLFDEMINDAGIDYKTRRFNGMFSLGGIDGDSPLFQPTPYEIEKVKRRASEKRHGWSK